MLKLCGRPSPSPPILDPHPFVYKVNTTLFVFQVSLRQAQIFTSHLATLQLSQLDRPHQQALLFDADHGLFDLDQQEPIGRDAFGVHQFDQAVALLKPVQSDAGPCG